jgi:Ca-activated chloride channel family protein
MTGFIERTHLCVAILLFIIVGLAACRPSSLQDGHQFYRDGKYEEALNAYKKGLVKNPRSHVFNYHVGIALYKKGDYEQAAEHFTKTLLTEDANIEARANYNMGNCKFRLGEQREKMDFIKTAGLFEEALGHYERAIQLDEKDEEAKYNRDLVKKKLEDVRANLSKRTAEIKKESVKDEKSKGLPPSQETFHSSGSPSLKESRQSRDARQDQLQKGDKKVLPPKGDGHQVRKEVAEMSKQEAEMLLEGFRREEELSMDPRERRRKDVDPDVQKDW